MRVAGREVDVDAAVKAVALGRIALGVGYTLTPALALRAWPGRPAATSGDGSRQRMMARSTGGRDIGLGLGVLFAQNQDAPVRGWLEAAMLADVADAVAILIAFRHLPRGRAVLMLGAALGTAVAGQRLARAIG